MSEIVCGIDAGGSKTDAIVCALDGAILGRARAGPGALRHHGGYYSAAIGQALAEACTAAGVEPADVAMASVGLAGVDGASIALDALRALEDLLPVQRLMVVNDAEIALHAGVAERPAGVVIAGTGSIAYGEYGLERTRVGGYGPLLGDEGSGFWFTKRALISVLLAAEGRGADTVLRTDIRTHFAIEDEAELIGLAAGGWREPHRIASFAPLVFAAAAQGDAVARGVVDQGACALAELGAALVERLPPGSEPLPVVLGGSVLANQPDFAGTVGGLVAERFPMVRAFVGSLPPAAGAALQAIHALAPLGGNEVRTRMTVSLASFPESIERTLHERA